MRIGASRAEKSLDGHRRKQPQRAAVSAPVAHGGDHGGEQFGQQQQGRGRREQADGPAWVPFRPGREELVGMAEVVRRDVGLHHQQGSRRHQEQEPEWRREIGHDAGHEHGAVRRVQSLGDEQAEILQVALAPAPVALEFVEKVRWHFLVAAGQVVGDPHRPAGAPHQRGLDEVVREDFARQGAAARQSRQGAVTDERRDADDRVVAPVVRFAELPEMQPAVNSGP
jgi:hypothetical protein